MNSCNIEQYFPLVFIFLLNLFKLSFRSSLKFLCTQVCQDFSLWLLCHMFYFSCNIYILLVFICGYLIP